MSYYGQRYIRDSDGNIIPVGYSVTRTPLQGKHIDAPFLLLAIILLFIAVCNFV